MVPLVIIDIDGLRPDSFAETVKSGRAPNFARLFGGQNFSRGLLQPALAPAPSITFASQASIITGAHPSQHGIPGSEFFDRHGLNSQKSPRHYAFDVGGTLSVDDAVRSFTDGLAGRCLQAPTLYEQAAPHGIRAAVIGHMYARGAETWRPASVVKLARLTKGKGWLRIEARDFDRHLLENALEYLDDHPFPDIFTTYFLGLDHESHAHGPSAQTDYLADVLDAYIGELWEKVRSSLPDPAQPPIWVVVSDHGHIRVKADDRHSLHLSFPFDRELAPLFDALGLDVHDFPGEDPHSDAVIALNGGMAHGYLRRRKGRWAEPPVFEHDVLPVAKAFWEGHRSGRYDPNLEGSLACVLLRDVEKEGWNAPYRALTPEGEIRSLETWFASQPQELYADPVHRLQNLSGPMSGDLVLVSNYAGGFYFSGITQGVHGGLHPEDSNATLAFGWPGASEEAWSGAQEAIRRAIQKRCQAEGGRQPSNADMLTGVRAVLGW
jgi:hypothetical protein